ncbi:serine/threonine protein kinase [Cladochytrium replicatum]|nr:serine/threonine protein kinase [Cladochytrium replicatum]
MRKTFVITTLLSAIAAGAAAADLQPVLLVGNNWEGTATVVTASAPFTKLGLVNIVPDKAERIKEINANPIQWIVYSIVKNNVGEGNDQMVDDLYATPDGQSVVVSRPSFGDVASISLITGKLNWRFKVSGYRSDHMAVSPDGTRVAVSDSLGNNVYILDINTGKQIGSFKTGDKPHENFFTNGGKIIWNMSIGSVDTSLDDPFWDWTKGDRHITVANATTFEIIKTIDMRDRLNAIGLKDFSDAVRPAVFLPDFSKLYFQVSFYNGFFEYDIATDKITRQVTLPEDPTLTKDRSKWLLDSRHHGITMNPSGTALCVAGTMDSYATVVDLSTFKNKALVPANKPYWATISGDGKHCVVSEAGADQITAIDFETGEKWGSVPVGDHPQRVRFARIPVGWTPPPASA